MSLPPSVTLSNFIRRHSLSLSILGIAILFILYTYGLTENPPGFYQDESAFAYNAYLLAKTGHSEFGVRWPLFLQNFTWPFTVYCNPVCIYLLAFFNLVFPPSIWLARLLSSVAGFETAMLLGLLAFRISRKVPIGVIVGFTALITPWLFEVDRLFFGADSFPAVAVPGAREGTLELVQYRGARGNAWAADLHLYDWKNVGGAACARPCFLRH